MPAPPVDEQRPRPLQHAVRARLADHRAPVAAGAAGRRPGDAARAGGAPGTALDPETEEEPGKIVHEYWRRAPARMVERGWPVRDGELRYYGSADSTPWFLVVLAATGDLRARGQLAAAGAAPRRG